MADAVPPLTRECPFCRETIRADALRCPHCTSSLLLVDGAAAANPAAGVLAAKEEEPEGKPGHVKYIVDSDLIRFVKVAAAALSLIIVVAGALTGIDLKKAVSDARSAADEAKSTTAELEKIKAGIAKSQQDLQRDQDSLQQQIVVAKGFIAEIQHNKEQSEELVLSQHAVLQQLPGKQTSGPTTNPTHNTGKKTSFTAPELARLYNFPPGLDGSGQTIAIVELGGGFRMADLTAYFQELKLPVPSVIEEDVDGSKNAPSIAEGADGEVMLNLEVAGAIAPKARLVIYFAPNTSVGFLDAVHRAVADKQRPPDVLLITWGGPENSWTTQTIRALNEQLQAASLAGITVVVSAGDSGTNDGTNSLAVDFPASSPWVLAVGGSKLEASGGMKVSETVWNSPGTGEGATGGGKSNQFAQPEYQASAHLPALAGSSGRGLPDVTANADPAGGYRIRVDGKYVVVGGTAAAAPLWAGLIALINQGVGHRVGFVNPALYKGIGASGAFNDITQGTCGPYKAGPGWDYCSGWGSPNGAKLLEAFRQLPH